MKRHILYIVVITCWSFCLPAILSAKEKPVDRHKPNIIFILADDLGYGDLGCYGQERIKTPHLDRLAAEGMRFTDCYAGSTVCAPSRCVLMTGLHTGHCRIRGNAGVALQSKDQTVAEVLQKAGYATAIIGKWGLGRAGTTGHPNKQGFDYFFGYLSQVHAHNYYPEFLWRNDEKVHLDNKVKYYPGSKLAGAATVRKTYSNDLFINEAKEFIKRSSHKPFFLYLAMTIPHANNESHLVDRHGMEVPDLGQYADKDWPEPQKGLAAMISRLDTGVGEIVDLLKTLKLDKETIIFFTSDNGPHAEGGNDPHFFDSNGPLQGIKRDLYEGGIRMPMMVRWPGKVPAGKTSDLVWCFADFLPTAASLAGVEVTGDIDGLNIVPTLRGGKQDFDRRYLYWEFHERGFDRSARRGKWKAVQNGIDKPMELYDLSRDIGEAHNVAAEHPEVVQELLNYMESARTPSKHWPLPKAESKSP